MTTSYSLVRQDNLAPGVCQVVLDVSVDSYTTGGITIDFSSYLPHRIHTCQVQGCSGTTTANNYWPEIRLTSRTNTATGCKMYIWASKVSIFESDNIVSGNSVVSGNSSLFVNHIGETQFLLIESDPVINNVTQKEARIEIADGTSLSGVVFYLVATGY